MPKTGPSPKELKEIKKMIWDRMKIKMPKKDVIAMLEKTKEAKEAEDLFHKALDSWPSMSNQDISGFRKIYESEYGTKKKLSDYEISEAARKISIIGTMQRQREAGAAIRAIMIKYKKANISNEDKEKLKKLFQIAFDINLTDFQIEYYLKLSHWFVWYEEGLEYSLSEALDNLLVHYDKKKRGKRGSLEPKDYEIGYFYCWLDYIIKEPKKDKKQKQESFKEITLNQFIEWMDKDFQSIRSFLAGDKCKKNKDGTFTMSVSLRDWD